MNNQNACERVLELLEQTVRLLIRGESAPDSPIQNVTTTDERREMRRLADRLLNGEADVRFKNLYNRKQLAAILLATVKRDQMRHEIREEFFRLAFEIGAAIHEDPPGTRKIFEKFFLAALLESKEGGPGSEGERRYRQLQKIVEFVKLCSAEKRRQRGSKVERRPRLAHDPTKRIPMIPAEIIDAPLPGETVIPIPPENPYAFDRMFIRIGVGKSSWVGNFASGLHPSSTVFMMPDGKHLFVSASGAGYILDLKSRTLVERTGSEVVGTHRNDSMTLFLVIHNGESLEGFGPNGRLWRTEPIGSGLRKIRYTDEEVIGEAWQTAERQWVAFAVDVATGEVRRGA